MMTTPLRAQADLLATVRRRMAFSDWYLRLDPEMADAVREHYLRLVEEEETARAWMRRWLAMTTETDIGNAKAIPNAELYAALRGDNPPTTRRRRGP